MNIDNLEMLSKYDDVLTFKEFQQVIKFGRNKCYELLNNGTIKSLKIGRDFRIPKINIIKFLLNEQQ